MPITVQQLQWEILGLKHHLIHWTSTPGSLENTRTLFLLCHGYLDMAWSWDKTARSLAAAGFDVLAFDWRGHGDSEWIHPSAYYHFPDYVRDLSEIMHRLSHIDSVHLVGHSMGGVACTLYSGVFSDRIKSLTLAEGLGPTHSAPQQSYQRMKAWFTTLQADNTHKHVPMKTLAEATTRIRINHPDIDQPWAEFVATKGTQAHDDGFVWKFDPRHRARSPIGFNADAFGELASHIEVPVLYVAAEHGLRVPDEAQRLRSFRSLALKQIPKCGHMMHWLAAPELAQLIVDFTQRC